MLPRLVIEVTGEPTSPAWNATAKALESHMDVDFKFAVGPGVTAGVCISRAVSAANSIAPARAFAPKLFVIKSETSLNDSLLDSEIKFADEHEVPLPFRGRKVRLKVPRNYGPLSISDGVKTLATGPLGPVWTMTNSPAGLEYRSAFGIPALPAGGNITDILNADRFMELLPLLQLLREIQGSQQFNPPPLRACFIFDDPNLHWPTYGYVDYRETVAHAVRHNYHVSYATVPLDAWFTHASTAQIFRSHPDRISLCVHGNDHVKRELAQGYTELQRAALLQQAVRRIQKLELRTGIKVARVMVPPHGACSDAMLNDLPRHGFESACISHGSLRAHNQEQPWAARLGFQPTEIIRGCPVMPRWAMTGSATNAVLLACYLGQPMVLRGHHQDIKSGIEVLDELAQFINGVGSVVWPDLADLSRMNYQFRVEGSRTCRLKVLGHKVVFPVSEVTERVVFDFPDLQSAGEWRVTGPSMHSIPINSGVELPLPPGEARKLMVEFIAGHEPPVKLVSRQTAPVALIRRWLTEGRDRFKMN